MAKTNKFKRIFFVLLFIILLPIIVLEKILLGVVKFIKKQKFKKIPYGTSEFLENADIEKIDIMEGYEFEKFLKIMYLYLGFQVEETARTGDYGADLILTKNNHTTVVQVKRYNANVGAKAIQEIYSAKEHYKADDMQVITNAHFTKQAQIMAKELNVLLIDREELISLLNKTIEIIKEATGNKFSGASENHITHESLSRFRI